MSAASRVREAGARDALKELVRAAVTVADRSDPELVRRLVESTGLSREGVAFGLERALERAPSEDDLSALLASVAPAEVVTVVLSANVFTAALRALCLARAAAPRVLVRPSRRDPHFARAIVAELADPSITLVDSLEPHLARAIGATRPVIHAYGRDESVAAIARQQGGPVWAHGTGLGVAVVSAGASLAEASAGLAEDMVAFDQRGCLSPRLLFSVGSEARALALAEALSGALSAWERQVPRGLVAPEERAELRRTLDTAHMCGEVIESAGTVVAVTRTEEESPYILLPTGRHLTIVPVVDLAEVSRRVARLGRVVVSIGASDLDTARAVAPPWARIATLGRVQRPPLDGPVDRRDVWL